MMNMNKRFIIQYFIPWKHFIKTNYNMTFTLRKCCNSNYTLTETESHKLFTFNPAYNDYIMMAKIKAKSNYCFCIIHSLYSL